MSEIRNFACEDVPAVAALFQRTFRPSEGTPPASLQAYFADAYLKHPWYDPDVAARVHVDEKGAVTGFVGVFPGRFELGGARYRAAIAGTLMVGNPEQDPLAGAKLLRSVAKGPQDMSISETTNLVSLGLWERLGGTVAPLLSLDWIRILRPASAAVSILAERHPTAAILGAPARLADRVGRRWTEANLRPVPPPPRFTREADPSEEALAATAAALARMAALHPAWSDGEDVRWFLAQAERKERYGAVHRAIVRDPKGEPVGCYIYHGSAGRTGRVLQVLVRPDRADAVIDFMLNDAREQGLAALRGRCTPQIANALMKRRCIFTQRAATVIHTDNEALASAVMRGDGLITGLAGESWTRLVGGAFT